MFTESQARAAISELNSRIDAAKADGAFDSNRTSFENELRGIFDNTSVAQADGSTPSTTVLYSGDMEDGYHSGVVARQLAGENPEVGIIDNTHASKLARSGEYLTALDNLFGDRTTPAAKAFEYTSSYEAEVNGGRPGIFDAMLGRFAATASGDIVTVSPYADPSRILSELRRLIRGRYTHFAMLYPCSLASTSPT